ncbi:hypothetical protein ACJU26_03980 [Acidithiobacillus sp. M4-SHS-6]|uniref:hypothetical protein n=1 Tax=Acidithiobacillus sp. M4-SHS-6 TaxID=3383024 RepID=UPI0039BDF8BD
MDELDEIAQLEASGQKLMTEPAPPPRKRETADAKRASTTGRSPRGAERQPVMDGDSAHVESLLAEIRDRLDLLLQANDPSQGANPSQGNLAENPQSPITSVPDRSATVESDELRKAFPLEDAEKTPAQAPANIMISHPDMARLLATVEDRVTRHAMTHHSSVVVLLGWAMAILASGLGMGYGYIVGSGRYPFWVPAAHAGILSRMAAAVLGAPVGVVLLPLAGAILWEAGKEAGGEVPQVSLRLAAIGIFLAGILLPVFSLF